MAKLNMYGVKNNIMTKTITQNKVYLMDCLEGMRNTPDKWYDLAVVDPPYGINASKGTWGSSNKGKVTNYGKKDWDKQPQSEEYFMELRRVSKNQIIWGANHFIENIPNANSSCWIIWDKDNSGDFADCEIAWTSFDTAVRKFTWRWNGMLQQNMKDKEHRIHPTQKPIALYDWIFSKYATKGMKILDTYAGSMSSVISALKNDMQITAYEIDSDYFNAGKQRIETYLQQGNMFQQPTIEFINH
jgi:site-specific DNA-methyltransferase (adenine-specific)